MHATRLCLTESDSALLKMSVPVPDAATPALPDFSRMTEDEQIAYALQMSMAGGGEGFHNITSSSGITPHRTTSLQPIPQYTPPAPT